MYGRRPANPAAAALAAHDLGAGNNPIVTGGRINPSVAQGEGLGDQERPRLIRAHGILMLIAWPFMAVTAIFFAAWMRPALPNGQWFQIHRFVMSGSILVGLVGFVLIFIANRNNSPPGLITLGSANVSHDYVLNYTCDVDSLSSSSSFPPSSSSFPPSSPSAQPIT